MTFVLEAHLQHVNAIQAAVTRTITALRTPPPAGPLPKDAAALLLQHLTDLLEIELALLSTVSIQIDEPGGPLTMMPMANDTVVQPPWYPDDSGMWAETYGAQPVTISDFTQVELLTPGERIHKKYLRAVTSAKDVAWENVVAYRTVS